MNKSSRSRFRIRSCDLFVFQDVYMTVQRTGVDSVTSQKGFDVLFAVLENFHKDLPHEYKETAYDTLRQAVNDFIRRADGFLCGGKEDESLLPVM